MGDVCGVVFALLDVAKIVAGCCKTVAFGCTPKLGSGFRIMEPYSAAAFFWPSSFMAVPKRACA